jgi:quercetin dioxygenase-like cupin family protein
MKAVIVQAEICHIALIVKDMRQADVDEFACLGMTPETAMTLSLKDATEAWTGLIDGVPVCMFGVSPSHLLTPLRGYPWMMGTHHLEQHAPLFLRRCKKQVARMQKLYPVLENWIAKSNTIAVMWLEWLGFELLESRPFGPSNAIFIKFRKEAPMDLAKKNAFKQGMEQAEAFMLQCEQIHCEPEHRFAEGLYSRTLTMPKDTIIASRVHLHENFAFIMRGSCIVVSDEGSTEYHAPCALITKKGTKRLLRIIEECTWVTVHAIPKELGEDIEKIEAYLAINTLEEYRQVEQQKVLEDTHEN